MSLELPAVALTEVEPSGSYLVLDDRRRVDCTLGDLQESDATHVCWVTYGDAVAAAQRRPTDTAFERVTMLAVGDLAGAGAGGGRDDGVRSVTDPLDLQSVGLSIHEFCTDHADEAVAVVVDTLSTLLAYAGPKAAFQFTHLVRRRVAAVDGHSFFLLDPDAHPDHVVGTLSTPFDAIVDPSGGGTTVELEEASDEDVAALVDSWTEEVDGGDADPFEWNDQETIPPAEEIRDTATPGGSGETDESDTGAVTREASDDEIAETLRDL